MNYCLAQTVLAARGDDAEGWINTLVVVLLVVFWAIGGILKARAKKTEAEDEDEYGEEPLEPAARPSTAKPVYKARGVVVQHPQPQRIRAGAKKIEARQAKPSVAVRKGRGPKAAVAKVTGEWAKKPVSAPEEPVIEPLLSAEEPDELKKAILHYEILGKPLSLREPVDEGLC
jgi:hypothetical protein